MKKGILATVIYNLVLWGIFLVFGPGLHCFNNKILKIYAVIMPVLFYIVYNKIFQFRSKGIARYLLLNFIQVVITISFAFVMDHIAFVFDKPKSGILTFTDGNILTILSMFSFMEMTLLQSLFTIISHYRTKIAIIAIIVYNIILWGIFLFFGLVEL